MKKLFTIFLVQIITAVSVESNAQILKNLFNSETISNVVSTVTGGTTVSAANMEGTWNYVKPAVELSGGTVLESAAGSLATTQIESKLDEYCTKVGIIAGKFSYVIKSDNTFSLIVSSRTISGTYTIDEENKKITFKYTTVGSLNIMPMTANVTLSDNSLSLLFNADKLLDLITKIASATNNNTLNTISTLTANYEGLLLGFELQK